MYTAFGLQILLSCLISPKKFPNCKIIYLDTNYRSEPEIIEIASKLIACIKKRFEKDFKGEKKGKGHIKITCFPDVVKQRDSVVEQLKKLHETESHMRKCRFYTARTNKI